MLDPARSAASRLITQSSRFSIPDFLVPVFSFTKAKRLFSNSPTIASRIGAAPLSVPSEVNLRLLDPIAARSSGIVSKSRDVQVLEVEGPSGKMSVEVPSYMTFSQDVDSRKATLSIDDKSVRKQREMWGTTRAVLNNHILGVSEGHTAILRLVGVGFRATVEATAVTKQPEYPGQKFVSLKVGYSHPIELGIPVGVKASVPQPTRILLEGSDKEVVKQFAAEIREWRKPEPYKGKGIFVNAETIRLKAKKIK
ncbi:MAG: hypothetical protein MMC23_003537 [Stictis urceolatum]|nr:hypothetical protein [Stictis urceolata]